MEIPVNLFKFIEEVIGSLFRGTILDYDEKSRRRGRQGVVLYTTEGRRFNARVLGGKRIIT